ncbi:hypothetical protein Sjap_014954 [Stephania japonica]|uniref:non-specific serine/threonine protein kinase n=1 Tax=Stephania japonica TaxID=461633 RepID=A0AAP0III7_9MAGN
MRWLSAMKWLPFDKTLLCTLLFLDLLLLVFSNVGARAVDSERSVLVQLKSSVSDPGGILSGWSSDGAGHHCSWFGVLCDRNYRVVALNVTGGRRGDGGNFAGAVSCSKFDGFPLYGVGIRRGCGGRFGKLGGKFSPLIGKLSGLRVLSMPFNEFTGEIPVEILGLESLEVIDLEGNLITGSLPLGIGELRGLRVLNLGFNRVFGEIPVSLSNCVGLEVLNLAGNQLNGSIPGFIGNFSKLRGLYLSLNHISGSVPGELGSSCRSLEHLDLSGNDLVGDIPRSLGNCSQLQSLQLYSNMLENSIPAELGKLLNLRLLDVSRNSLSGPLPAELGKCAELSVLVLSSLYDPLKPIVDVGDESYSQLSNATNDDFNYFQGGIPVEITTLPKLKVIWAPRATLEGEIPTDWGTCESLEIVNLGQNIFTGEVPEVFVQCKNLYFLDLSGNRLAGELDAKLPVSCMAVLDVSRNLLSGSIPIFNYGICPQIPSVNAYLGQSYDTMFAYSSYFVFRTQTATQLPSLGASGTFGIFHNFGGNNFTGSLPPLPISPKRLGAQTVYAFLAGGNKLTGPFPGNLFEKCDGVSGMITDVSRNQLFGSIPLDIGSGCRSLKLLNISMNLINGSVPESLGNLTSLVSLDLSWNKLQGQIPLGLCQSKSLKYLSLAGNKLTGDVPSNLGQLQSLEVLKLSSNSLSGEIPEDLVNLRNLSVLLLNNNKLSGNIPTGLAAVRSLSEFNVSFNNLSGALPFNDSMLKCSSVLGNPFLQPCHLSALSSVPPSDVPGGSVSQNSADSPAGSVSKRNGSKRFNSIEIASITSASAIVSVLLALVVLFLYTRKCTPRSRVGGSERRREVKIFTEIGVQLTFENVVRATGCFNAGNCIGNGGFGATYKAEVSQGVLLAIKRLSVGRFQGIQQFHAEIKTLGRVRHQNLVTLIGYHASETEMFLIYNYLPGGNLEKFIQERSERAVDWKILHKIAVDIARALAYLHDQCVPRILHRDVKPSNILLDNDHNAYLSDFGLARLLGTSETHATTGVAGTFGYVAPEYAMTCRVSDKADVYSYGVVLLELISDKKVLDPSFSSYGNGFNIVAWACMLLRQGRAKEFFTTGLWDAGPHDSLVETLHLAVMCTVDSLSIRPTMKQVVQRLKQLQPSPC